MKTLRWFLVATLFILMACNEARDPKNMGKPIVTGALDYGNGIYYFPYSEADFGNALSAFLASHQNLDLVAMASDDTYGRGETKGYFVVFRTLRR